MRACRAARHQHHPNNLEKHGRQAWIIGQVIDDETNDALPHAREVGRTWQAVSVIVSAKPNRLTEVAQLRDDWTNSVTIPGLARNLGLAWAAGRLFGPSIYRVSGLCT